MIIISVGPGPGTVPDGADADAHTHAGRQVTVGDVSVNVDDAGGADVAVNNDNDIKER